MECFLRVGSRFREVLREKYSGAAAAHTYYTHTFTHTLSWGKEAEIKCGRDGGRVVEGGAGSCETAKRQLEIAYVGSQYPAGFIVNL